MFTVKSQLRIAQKFDNIPDIKLNAIFREVEKETEGMIVERGFLRELRESLDHLRTWFDASQLLAVDKEGNEKKTAIVIVKNLHHLVSALILKHNIRRHYRRAAAGRVVEPELEVDAGDWRLEL